MKYSELKDGMTVYVDGGFPCMKQGPKVVHSDATKPEWDRFYVECRSGRHYLSGQRMAMVSHSNILSGVSRTPF